MDLAYRLLNVFTVPDDRLSGNPLCVFEDGAALDAGRMQALARQFNLSETTFLLPPRAPGATARVRIFTPGFEMPFAGHPSLGSAHVVRSLRGGRGPVVLEEAAGLVEVATDGDRFTLRAPRTPSARAHEARPDDLSAMLGLPAGSVERALWVDAGVEQLLLRVRDVASLRAARPGAALLDRHARSPGGESMAWAFAEGPPGEVEARGFFVEHGAVAEDPATGSACANLGAWLVTQGERTPLERTVSQGAQVGRPSRLFLRVEADRSVRVGGDVVELGRGSIRL
jgi:PhzF family phenazine biosynthesis protein